MEELKKAYAAIDLLKTLHLPISEEQLKGITELENQYIDETISSDIKEIVEGYILPELGEFHLSVKYSPEEGVIVSRILSSQHSTNTTDGDKKKKHDTTRFSFDGGGHYYTKRHFVYEVVKDYIRKNPDVTFDELEKVFPSHIHGAANGVVRKWIDVQHRMIEHPDLENRFFCAIDERLTLADGTVIVVNDQWGAKFPNFLRVAKLMYDIKSTAPYEGL